MNPPISASAGKALGTDPEASDLEALILREQAASLFFSTVRSGTYSDGVVTLV